MSQKVSRNELVPLVVWLLNFFYIILGANTFYNSKGKSIGQVSPSFSERPKNVWKFLTRREKTLLILCNLTYHFWKNWIFLRFVPYIHFEASYEPKINYNRVSRYYQCWLKQTKVFEKHFPLILWAKTNCRKHLKKAFLRCLRQFVFVDKIREKFFPKHFCFEQHR